MTSLTATKTRIQRGDTVRILLGKDRGKQGRVLAVVPQRGRVIVEGLNQVKKHVRARRAGEKGQRVTIAAPLDISNVQLICPACGQATRVAIKRQAGDRTRVCKKCQADIPVPARS